MMIYRAESLRPRLGMNVFYGVRVEGIPLQQKARGSWHSPFPAGEGQAAREVAIVGTANIVKSDERLGAILYGR